MPDPGKLEKEAKWMLLRAKKHLKNESMRWESNRNLMFGKLTSDERGPVKNSIAEVYGTWRTLISNILAQTPECLIQSKKPELDPFVVGLSDVVNYDFKVGKVRNKLVRALWQNFPYGMGIIAEDFTTVKAYNEKGEVTGIESIAYNWRNIPARDALFDPDGFEIDLRDHRVLFLAYYKTVRELKTEKNDEGKRVYRNTEDIENLPRANPLSKTERDRYFQADPSQYLQSDQGAKTPPEFHQLKIWRMYDRENEKIQDFADFDHRLLLEDEWPMKVKIQGVLQFPIKILALNVDPDKFYPTPECDLVRSQIANKVKLNEILMTDSTTKIRRYLGLSPYVTKDLMGKLLDPKMPNSYQITTNLDLAAANADIPKVDSAADLIHKIPDIEPDPNLVPAMGVIDNQLFNIMGYKQAGAAGGPQVRSAKEAARIADAMQRSLVERQTTIEEFVRDMVIYHVMLLKETAAGSPMAEKRYFPVVSELGVLQQWQEFDPNKIPDEKYLAWDIYVGSSTPQTLDSKRAQTMQMVQILAPILSQEGYSLVPLLNEWAKVFTVRNVDQLMRNQKGAARVLLGALIKAGQMGREAPPDLLLHPAMETIQAVLSPGEIKMVVEAMQKPGKAASGGGGNGKENAPAAIDPMRDAGNPAGAVSPT